MSQAALVVSRAGAQHRPSTAPEQTNEATTGTAGSSRNGSGSGLKRSGAQIRRRVGDSKIDTNVNRLRTARGAAAQKDDEEEAGRRPTTAPLAGTSGPPSSGLRRAGAQIRHQHSPTTPTSRHVRFGATAQTSHGERVNLRRGEPGPRPIRRGRTVVEPEHNDTRSYVTRTYTGGMQVRMEARRLCDGDTYIDPVGNLCVHDANGGYIIRPIVDKPAGNFLKPIWSTAKKSLRGLWKQASGQLQNQAQAAPAPTAPTSSGARMRSHTAAAAAAAAATPYTGAVAAAAPSRAPIQQQHAGWRGQVSEMARRELHMQQERMGLRRANTANASRSDRSPERIKRQNSSGGGAQSCNPYEEASGAQRLEAQRYQIPRKAVPQRQPDAPLRPLYLPAEVLARQQQQEIHQRRLRQRRLDMADFRRAMQERNEQSGSPDPSPSPPDLGYQRVQLVDIPTLQKLTSYNELRDPNDSDDEYVQMSRRAAAATAANAAQAAAAAPRARSRPRSYTAPAAITNTATSNTATANTATAGEREWRKSELAGPAGVHRWASSAVKAKGPSRGKTRIADTGNSSSSSTDDDSPLRLDGALRPGAGLGPVPSQFFHEAIDAWSGAGPAATKPKGNWI